VPIANGRGGQRDNRRRMDLIHCRMVVPSTLTLRTMELLTADDHVLKTSWS
jgi:hypothetical protein